MKRVLRLSLLSLLLLSSCASTGDRETYSLVFLDAGPVTEIGDAELEAAREGHRSNIQRLGEERTLLLAGPFAEPKLDPKLQGLYFFDVAPKEALELTAQDPAAKAGLLAARVFGFESTPDLRLLPVWNSERQERGEPFEGALYFLAFVDEDAKGEEALTAMGNTLLFEGTLDGDYAGRRLLVLDVETVDAAIDLVGAVGELEFHPWYASTMLRQLPSLRL